MIKSILRFFGGLAFIVLLLSVSGKLFFEKEFDHYAQKAYEVVFPDSASASRLRVAISSDIASLEPTIYETNSRSFMMNVYESLVRPNKFLKLRPQLALSWGVLDDKVTWEFKLRKNVKFHDGTVFDADDVVASFNRALEFPGSQLKTVLANVSKVEKVDELTVRIKTKQPDAVFPLKLSTVLMFPSERSEFVKNSSLIGTGPYKFEKKEDDIITLYRTENYWGASPRFEIIDFFIISDKFDRIEAMKQKQVDIVLNVPPDNVKEVESFGYNVDIRPGLEANFLFFNFDHPDMSQKRMRKAVSHAINKSQLNEFGSKYIDPISQFVPSGILGFNPEVQDFPYSLSLADNEVRLSQFKNIPSTLVMAKRLEILGNFIRDSLGQAGIATNLKTVPEAQLVDEIQNADIYFIGWRFNLGDVADFLGEVVHSPSEDGTWGKLNFMNYKNDEVDQLIEDSFSSLDNEERARILKQIMKIIVEDDIIGVPLFTSKILSAKLPHVDWEPRLDTYFIASEVK